MNASADQRFRKVTGAPTGRSAGGHFRLDIWKTHPAIFLFSAAKVAPRPRFVLIELNCTPGVCVARATNAMNATKNELWRGGKRGLRFRRREGFEFPPVVGQASAPTLWWCDRPFSARHVHRSPPQFLIFWLRERAKNRRRRGAETHVVPRRIEARTGRLLGRAFRARPILY